MRAFIAIELPGSIQSNIREVQEILRREPMAQAIRFVSVENIHLTLKFLGDIENNQISPILEALKIVAGRSPVHAVRVDQVGCFPNLRRPRVVWLGIKDPQGHLGRMHPAIENELKSLDFEPENRRFHPHLTLGRVKKSATPDQVAAIGRWVEDSDLPVFGTFDVKEIHLIQSTLTPQGAAYTRLGSAALQGEQ